MVRLHTVLKLNVIVAMTTHIWRTSSGFPMQCWRLQWLGNISTLINLLLICKAFLLNNTNSIWAGERCTITGNHFLKSARTRRNNFFIYINNKGNSNSKLTIVHLYNGTWSIWTDQMMRFERAKHVATELLIITMSRPFAANRRLKESWKTNCRMVISRHIRVFGTSSVCRRLALNLWRLQGYEKCLN